MKQTFTLLLAALPFLFSGCSQGTVINKELAVVPYPKNVTVYQEYYNFNAADMGVKAGSGTERLAGVISDDIYRLTGIKPTESASAIINLSISRGMDDQQYKVTAKDGKINIAGGSYRAVAMGWSTVIQSFTLDEGGKMIMSKMNVKDAPDLEYRSLLLDLARQFHTDHVVKQVIDICRWYKIAYLQLHLNDDSRNVFPTKLFPKTLIDGEYYTEAQLREIIDYADARGVTIVPEIEGPGHSTNMRKAYPEIFGEPDLRTINLADDQAVEAMKKFSKEVMDFFTTSPYFHIGADEVNLDILKEMPQAQQRIKDRGYDDVHDLYLEYVAGMHEFVKENGRQTMVWEGFDKDGSAKVKIPKDIIVCAFETLYQRPDSLAQRGYRVVNSSWKPIYIVPNLRWSAEKIYSWNYYTWENWWDIAPATKEPIVLNEKEREMVLGTNMCAWEMNEEMEYPALRRSLAALGEVSWNTGSERDYKKFEQRMEKCEKRLHNLVYPFEIAAEGLVDPDYKGVNYNWENFFAPPLKLSLKSNIPGATFRYTVDRSFPGASAAEFPGVLSLDKPTFVKIAQYDASGKLISYYPVWYQDKPIKIEFISDGDVKNDNNKSQEITFNKKIIVKMSTPLTDGTIRYTINGLAPAKDSPDYTGEITMFDGFQLRAQYFDAAGNPVGASYHFWVSKK